MKNGSLLSLAALLAALSTQAMAEETAAPAALATSEATEESLLSTIGKNTGLDYLNETTNGTAEFAPEMFQRLTLSYKPAPLKVYGQLRTMTILNNIQNGLNGGFRLEDTRAGVTWANAVSTNDFSLALNTHVEIPTSVKSINANKVIAPGIAAIPAYKMGNWSLDAPLLLRGYTYSELGKGADLLFDVNPTLSYSFNDNVDLALTYEGWVSRERSDKTFGAWNNLGQIGSNIKVAESVTFTPFLYATDLQIKDAGIGFDLAAKLL